MITSELLAYIRKQKELGVPEETFKGMLLSQGWKVQEIDEAMTHISGGIPLPPPLIPQNNFKLVAKTITFIQILAIIPVCMGIISETQLYSLLPQNIVSSLQNNIHILLLTLFTLLACGLVINLLVKKRTGMKTGYLTASNRVSTCLLLLWPLLVYWLHTYY
jgi:hypothetical protein